MRSFLPVVVFVGLTGTALPQTSQTDSAVVQLPEVVVTATRTNLPVDDSPSPVEVISVGDEQRLEGGLLADVLSKSNGVFLQDLGGSGALKTAFVRGSAPSQLLVLVNGNRINSFQNDLVDFSLLPLGMVDKIEVSRGGASALYGADALAGVVNILTRSSTDGLHARAEVAVGSYGFQHWGAEAGGGSEVISLLGGITQEKGTDDYPFATTGSEVNDTTVHRKNSDFSLRQIYLQGNGKADDRSTYSFTVQGVHSERGVPGSISFPSDAARQRDETATVLGQFQTLHVRGLDFQFKTGFNYSNQIYRDPNPFYPIDATYRNTLLTLNPQVQLLSNPAFQSTIGIEFNQGQLRGNDFQGSVTRIERAAYSSSEYHVSFDRDVLNRLSLYAMLRYDAISDVENAFTPKFGFNLRILRAWDLRVRGSYGQSFRAPSFNDLYYVGFNNPDLKPEKSRTLDAGLMTSWDGIGHHSFELTYFSMNTTDRILFDLTTYKPENIGKSRSSGIEATYAGVLPGGLLDLGINYSFTDTRKLNRISPDDPTYNKHLPYVPAQLGSISAGASMAGYRLTLVHTFTGRRYTTEDNSASISPFQLTDINASATIGLSEWRVIVTASVHNVTDRRYEIFPGYPMPGRTFRLALGLWY